MKAINMTSFFETEDFENVEIEDVANASIGFPLKKKKEDKRGFLLKNWYCLYYVKDLLIMIVYVQFPFLSFS